jgi:hypothetical protein
MQSSGRPWDALPMRSATYRASDRLSLRLSFEY